MSDHAMTSMHYVRSLRRLRLLCHDSRTTASPELERPSALVQCVHLVHGQGDSHPPEVGSHRRHSLIALDSCRVTVNIRADQTPSVSHGVAGRPRGWQVFTERPTYLYIRVRGARNLDAGTESRLAGQE